MAAPEAVPPQVAIVKSGPADVVASGSVFAFNGNPIEIKLGVLSIVFSFRDDKAHPEPSLEAKAVDGRTLELILKNFDNVLGAGSTKPLQLGTIRLLGWETPRHLYLNYRVYASPPADKLLHYSFYAESEVRDNG